MDVAVDGKNIQPFLILFNPFVGRHFALARGPSFRASNSALPRVPALAGNGWCLQKVLDAFPSDKSKIGSLTEKYFSPGT